MKRTQFNRAHHILKGKMVDFVGWELPVQYEGLNREHLAVRQAAGIFDVSHMGEILIRGPQALDAVQHITSNNAAKLVPGKIQYSGLLTGKGCFVDDLLVYHLGQDEYLLVVNAANVDKDHAWIKEKTDRFDAEIVNESDEFSQVAVQGPASERILSQLTDTDLTVIPYYHFTRGRVSNLDAIISRTGYTGEDGFEVYFKGGEDEAVDLFLRLVELGKPEGAVPAGLGARDTLRLEAKMCLYGNDIDETTTVLEADLAWILKLKKGDFIGREALLAQKARGIERKLVGFELEDRGIARHGYPVFVDDHRHGEVTSGTHAPFLNKPIGLTYLPIEKTEAGTRFQIGIRNHVVNARVVETPFYKR